MTSFQPNAVATPSGAALEVEHGTSRILVVDDEPSLRRVASRVLQLAGYEVVQAGDGSEALGVLQAGNPPIHLVVADLFMPVMGGVELRRLTAAGAAAPPFLLTSGCSEEKEVLRQLGDDRGISFIAKPWTPVELVDRVRSILSAEARSA